MAAPTEGGMGSPARRLLGQDILFYFVPSPREGAEAQARLSWSEPPLPGHGGHG